jgi:hypothetical protein
MKLKLRPSSVALVLFALFGPSVAILVLLVAVAPLTQFVEPDFNHGPVRGSMPPSASAMKCRPMTTIAATPYQGTVPPCG